MVVDAFGSFTNVLARFPGNCHDMYIFDHSVLREAFERIPVLAHRCLLADSGYAERPYLRTPISEAVTEANRR